MEFRLLGPLEVAVDGVPQRLMGRGERALLTLLLLSVDRSVSASGLIERLWASDAMPADPVNALQLRVSKLRRALGAWGIDGCLVREPAGYRLAVDPSSVDVERFVAAVAKARSIGNPVDAVEKYDEALALWRAEPFAEFAGEPWTAAEAALLTELYLSAVAERAERMLTLGRYDKLCAELGPVVAGAPTRERLVGQLMTGLFNAGRQADALSLYTRTRRVLADELGVDPSRDLREVMEQILRHDAALRPTTARQRAGLGQLRPDSAPAAGGNLPFRTTSFVGRDADIARTVDELSRHRLVTLAGPGGAGKTALAIEAARVTAAAFPDGAWLVQLAAISEADGMVHAAADAIGIGIGGGTAIHRPIDLLIAQLAPKHILIVLDNCEHLIEPIALFVETLLARCPQVSVLATSREALAVTGEVQRPVAPLAVPADDALPAQIPDYAAAQLFLDRAHSVVSELAADDATLSAVGVICRRLDGIPLALELAAARLPALGPAELADRLQDRFALLNAGSRTAEARQRTLKATVDWSHDLLTTDERMLFRRLSVFAGGWDLAAAEAVAADDALPSGDVFDLLERLVRQSMVLTDHGRASTRYRMLETLRQYATLQLGECGESERYCERHARYFVQLVEQAEIGLRGATQARWVEILTAEHANIRAALSWLTGRGRQPEVDLALRLCGSLGLYWHMGRHLEGRAALRQVLALPGGTPVSRARALQAVSLVERPRACLVHPSEQCAAAARESLQIFDDAGDRHRAAFSKLLLSVEGVRADDPFAADLLNAADREFASIGDAWGRAVAAFVRMETLTKRGLEAESRQAAAVATARFRQLQDGWGLSAVLYHVGWALTQFGHDAEAVPVLEEAIAVATDAGVHNTAQWALADLGMALLGLGRLDEAADCFARAGVSTDTAADEAGGVLAAYGRAVLAQTRRDHDAARPLFAIATDGFAKMGVRLAMGRAMSGLADCVYRADDPESASRLYSEVVDLGDSAGEPGLAAAGLEGLARGAAADGKGTEAARLLARAATLRETHGRPATPPETAVVDEAEELARRALGDANY
ncbi:MAG TPA: BTAD domain-containing putative transcriptional regulator [Microlunatus sp.]|nr:BTAD domain-containing putative transcriptional regulator [Microlunatus sp.]